MLVSCRMIWTGSSSMGTEPDKRNRGGPNKTRCNCNRNCNWNLAPANETTERSSGRIIVKPEPLGRGLSVNPRFGTSMPPISAASCHSLSSPRDVFGGHLVNVEARCHCSILSPLLLLQTMTTC